MKWKGWGEEHNTWEPIDNVKDVTTEVEWDNATTPNEALGDGKTGEQAPTNSLPGKPSDTWAFHSGIQSSRVVVGAGKPARTPGGTSAGKWGKCTNMGETSRGTNQHQLLPPRR